MVDLVSGFHRGMHSTPSARLARLQQVDSIDHATGSTGALCEAAEWSLGVNVWSRLSRRQRLAGSARSSTLASGPPGVAAATPFGVRLE